VHFLAPFFMLLAGGAVVPALLHLMRRRSGVRIEFPAARYLARAEREHSRELRLRNLLLMVLRILAIVALALAAARPVSRALGWLFGHSGSTLGVTHAPLAVAVVVDNSLSTSAVIGGRTVLDRLKDGADLLLGRLAPGDRAWLITADGSVQGGSQSAVRDRLRRTQPIAAAGDPEAATARGASLAASFARSTGLTDAVVAVATDGQATTWTSTVDVGRARAAVFAPPDPPPANHAVVEATGRPERWTPRGAIAARFAGVVDSATYRIDLGTRALARGTTTAAGAAAAGDSGAATAVVNAAPPERGWVAGAVALEPDELRGDDLRHFAIWIGDPPVVAVDSAVGPFLRAAMTTLEATARAVAPGGTQALSSSAVAVVPADRLARLPALIVAPADPVRVGAANRALEHAGVPWRFGALVRTAGDLRGVGDDVTVSTRYELEGRGPAGGDTLARVGGAAWGVAGPGYVLLASPIDPASTTLPVRASFVPWLADLLAQRLAPGAGGGVVHAAPGATIPRPSWADGWEPATGGPSESLSGATVTLPDSAGVWFLRRGEARVGAVVVDAEPRESDLARLSTSALATRVHSESPVLVLARADRWADAVLSGGGGRPLATPLFAVSLALLLAESALTRRRVTPRGSVRDSVRVSPRASVRGS